MELGKDIEETSSKILEILKDFEKRTGYHLELNYVDRIIKSKLIVVRKE